jgi:hypothetical protein
MKKLTRDQFNFLTSNGVQALVSRGQLMLLAYSGDSRFVVDFHPDNTVTVTARDMTTGSASYATHPSFNAAVKDLFAGMRAAAVAKKTAVA